MTEFYFFLLLTWLAGIRTDIARNAGQKTGYGRACELLFLIIAIALLIKHYVN